jgi:cation:H+ antiporter
MLTALYLAAGLVLLYFGAEWLVRGSSTLALRFGVPSLVVGLTVVAFGTSAPELVVSIKTNLAGLSGMAIGNVVGSNIFNIAVILGLSALVRPIRVNVQVLKVDTPLMVLLSFVLFLMLHDGFIQRLEAVLLFTGILIYTGLTIFLGKSSQKEMPIGEAQSLNIIPQGSAWSDVFWIILGLGGLVLGSDLFVKGAIDLATALKVSQAIIGLTIVAAGTSLPELATSIVAAAKKQEDIAIGNIIGSNIFNILAILGVSGMIRPLDAQGVGTTDLLFMLGTSILLLPLMRTRFKLGRLEGALFLVIYGTYLWVLWPK